MFLRYADRLRRWVTDDEPELPLEWARAAGLFNARLLVSPDELRHIQEQLETLLQPYLTRQPAAAPPRLLHASGLAEAAANGLERALYAAQCLPTPFETPDEFLARGRSSLAT